MGSDMGVETVALLGLKVGEVTSGRGFGLGMTLARIEEVERVPAALAGAWCRLLKAPRSRATGFFVGTGRGMESWDMLLGSTEEER